MIGFTKEERFLNNLGQDTFLHFWSWPNLFRDQGCVKGKSDGKEICDLTVIFGNDILLFSDKKIEFNNKIDVEIAWCRWARKAIRDSIKQIKGARRWISDYPDRIYLDPKCEEKIPINIPSKDDIEYHNIVVCHGIEDVLSKFNHEASFLIDNSINGESHWDTESCTPFSIGRISEGSFVHIFNESTIELVLKEFDTARDFIIYIKQRELLINSDKTVKATSESDLIQLYYENFDEEKGHHSLLPEELKEIDPFIIDKGGIHRLYSNPSFVAKKKADQVSYFWDDLTECFSFHILNGTAEDTNFKSSNEIEPGIRQLASSGRFERRVLADAFLEFYHKVLPSQRGTRLFFDPLHKSNAYLFLAVPYVESHGSHEKYRKVRRELLSGYCIINKLLNPSIEYIVGIACKTREDSKRINRSFFDEGQDFSYADFTEWGEEDETSAKRTHDEYIEKGLLVKRALTLVDCNEFPEGSVGLKKQIAIKGKYRNLPCLCGSGEKIKKCCGKR